MTTPYRCTAPYDWQALLTLIQTEFAAMDGRIDPPSSMHRLTAAAIAKQAATAEVWAIGTPPVACVFMTPRPRSLDTGSLYIGKLAVARSQRRQGLARALVATAETRARALGLPVLELQTRVELTENHDTFRALGFIEVARTAHPGSDRPTTITFRRPVP